MQDIDDANHVQKHENRTWKDGSAVSSCDIISFVFGFPWTYAYNIDNGNGVVSYKYCMQLTDCLIL